MKHGLFVAFALALFVLFSFACSEDSSNSEGDNDPSDGDDPTEDGDDPTEDGDNDTTADGDEEWDGVCEPESLRCVGQDLERCGDDGQWAFYRNCPQYGLVCQEDDCVLADDDDDDDTTDGDQPPLDGDEEDDPDGDEEDLDEDLSDGDEQEDGDEEEWEELEYVGTPCPGHPEMVSVNGEYCIDRFEAVANSRLARPSTRKG